MPAQRDRQDACVTTWHCCRTSADDKFASVSSVESAMSKIPLMDYVGRPLLACLFVILLWLQWRFPLRRQRFSVLHRLVRNFVLSIPRFALARLVIFPLPTAIAGWAGARPIELLRCLPHPA